MWISPGIHEHDHAPAHVQRDSMVSRPADDMLTVLMQMRR
jgi:hypothetical protein